MEKIRQYFPALTEQQYSQLDALYELYTDWNSKINVISRKDIENLYLHHVLHSLAIAKVTTFAPGTKIADIGTGGGIPGIPLAILFPESHFTLPSVKSTLAPEKCRCRSTVPVPECSITSAILYAAPE